MKKIIIGAGLTGLSAGIHTGSPVYEAKDHSGGICRSYNMNGFEFSVGGPHWLFGKGIGLDFIKRLVEVNEYERIAGVYYNKIFPFPIQKFAQQDIVSNENSMKHSLSEKFGVELGNMFFTPFNEKYTCGLYDHIMNDDDYKSPQRNEKGHILTFCDPVNGLNELIDKMEEKCDVKYNKKVKKILMKEKQILFEDGETVKYDKLISTMPLNTLLKISGCRKRHLPYTSVLVINIGARLIETTPKEFWLYVPFCNSGFYRIGFASNVNPKKAPENCVSLSVEIPFKPGDNIDINKKCDDVIKELTQWGFIGSVFEVDPTVVNCAYTWIADPSQRYEAIKYLEDNDIISTGRYGKWKFCGMVESIEMGLSV